MKAKSKFLAVLLTLAMLLSMLPMGAMAVAETAPPDQPAVVTPVPDDTTTGGPATDAPAPDVPATDAPATDAPVTDAPATDDPSVTPPADPPANPPADPAADPAENSPVGPMDGAVKAEGDAVAKIGTNEYATFEAALAEAETDNVDTTITLLKDCEYARSDGQNGTSISHNLTITSTGNKKLTLTPNASGYHFLVVGSSVTLTLNNIDIATTGKNDIFHNSGILSITGCNLTAGNPENGIFNMAGGTVTMNSGTLDATGFITSGGNGLSLKTGSGGVDITSGTIRLNKDTVITLLAGSTEPTTAFKIQPSESTAEAQNAAAGDVLLKGNVADDAKLADIAAQITVGDGTSWNVAKSGTDLVMHQLDTVKYVHAPQLGTGIDGSLANPFTTLQAAYNALPEAGGEIRVLYDMTTEAALNCSAAKAVTITSAYRYNNISLKPDYPAANEGWTVKRGETLKNQTACTVSAGSVTLKNIVFDGGAKWGSEGLLARTNTGIRNVAAAIDAGQLFAVNAGGALTLDTGAVLQNNDRQHSAESGGDRGSAVYVDGGTLTMSTGASIKNNRVTNELFTDTNGIGDGAAVAIWGSGTFTMNGGSITGNTVGRMGGAIRVAEADSHMYLYGGEISGNATKSATNCGGISVNDGTLYLKGTPVVKDNLQNTTKCNIIYKNKIVIDVSSLTAGANIGVTGSAGDVTTASAVEDDLPYFHSDTIDLVTKFADSKIVLAAAPKDTYVSSNGSDSNSGTAESPFRTLQHAYNVAQSGDTIQVMNDITVPLTEFKADKNVTIQSVGGTHSLKRGGTSIFTISDGVVTLKDITLTDSSKHDNSPVILQNKATAKLILADGATITGTESNFGAVYVFTGILEMQVGSKITNNTNKGSSADDTGTIAGAGGAVTLEGHATAANLVMTGGTISGNKAARGGGVYIASDAVGGSNISVAGNVKISGNTLSDGTTASNIYLGKDDPSHFTVSANLTADARIGISGVDGILDTSGKFGATTADLNTSDLITAAHLSNVMQDGAASPNPVAIYKATKELHWAAADTNWLDWVATQSYGWNDTNPNLVPDGIAIDTPMKLYSLAYAIAHNYDPTTKAFDASADTARGTSYANGFYDLIANLDMTGFKWIPIGTTAIPFTGVFEGYPGTMAITGISHKAGLTENGLFGVVALAGARDYPGGVHSWVAPYDKTLIQNVAVDGGGKIWTSSTTTHMGGIAAKATSATIQNCSVRNLNLKILNTAASVFAGGIVGEATTCSILNNSVVKCTITPDADGASSSSYAGGIVGKAASTAISGNIVGGNNGNQVAIVAVPNSSDTSPIYAGGVVGHMTDGSIANETWAHLNAMTVTAENNVTDAPAYAGGVAGYLAGAATMTGCTPGANNGEKHSITAQGWNKFATGKNYAGGLVGGMEGTSSIASSTIGASDSQSYTVTAGVGAESVAGGLVGTMVGTTVQSLTDCTISGDSMDSVKVTAAGTAGTAGGLVGTAKDARVIKCSAQNISVFGGKASGGLAGTFKANTLATADTSGGLMAMCYVRNCNVTEIAAGQGSYCDMIQTAEKALILACYASKDAPRTSGIYAVKTATGSKFVGCYTTANQAPKFAADNNGTYINCYFIGGGTADGADTVKGIPLTAFTDSNDATLRGFMNTALASAYDAVTGNLRMGYMAGQSAQINGNYNYPVYAVYLLTVNSLPSSVYGTYTVTADSKPIATDATGFNQYWVGKGAEITIAGDPDDYYATVDAATFTIVDADGTNSGTDVTDVAMDTDKTATVTFTQQYFPGWTINGTHSNDATIYSDASIQNGALSVVTDNKLAGNTVKNWERNASNDWAEAARTIKTIFVTASTTTSGASNPTISAFTADGWTVATGGVNKGYVQLTNAQGANAAEVSAIVNSIEFAANKTSTGTVSVDVQVYVDETVRGSMYFFGGSVYELAGSAVGQPAAKALAENSTVGAKKGHLVVIGSSAEHAFLKDNVKTNAWTAAESTSNNTTLTNWTWDGISATTDETSYLQNQTSWQNGEPNNSGTYATYNYGGKFDDTNGANVALIEYDGKTASAAGWQAYSALAIGTVSVYVSVPSGGGGTNPTSPTTPPKPTKPGTIKPVDPQISGVATLLNTDAHMEYLRGDQTGSFHPTSAITRAEVAQLFYNLLRDKNGEAQATFTDVKDGAWYAEAVNRLAAMGILKGKSAGIFKPNDPISRAEFTTVALRFAKGIQGKVSFEDVPESYWAHDNITGAAQYGWIQGYADGSFKPLNPITRAEAVKMVNTMLGRFPDEAFIDKSTDVKTFPDVKSDYWAFYEIVEATNAHAFSKDKDGAETWKR